MANKERYYWASDGKKRGRKNSPGGGQVPVSEAVSGLRPLRPKWEGLHSFNRVWDDAVETTLGEGGDIGGLPILSCVAALAARSGKTLAKCHPINFGCAQLEAVMGIMEADGVNPWEFLADTNLPFDELFLDYSAIGSRPAGIPWGEKNETLALYGASVAYSSEASAPHGSAYSAGQKHIVPYGTDVRLPDNRAAARIGHIDSDGNEFSISSATSLGEFALFDDVTDAVPQFIAVRSRAAESASRDEVEMNEVRCAIPVRSLPALAASLGRGELEAPEQRVFANAPAGATIFVGAQPDLLSLIATSTLEDGGIKFPIPFDAAPEQTQRNLITDAIMVLARTVVVIDSLYFLDSHNVAVEEAVVSRQVRRAAARSGGEVRIANVVRVAPTKVTRNPNKPRGGTANYSHRFERRGYTRHVTRGSHAKADLMRPCYRRDQEGNLTCPKGCRREWTPPTIVGSEDLPFVPKARIVPGLNTEN
jgi:hypothetical protein